jgi:hypothetical protein
VESSWVHSALRPPKDLLCQPRVIVMVEWWLAGKTEVFGENQTQSHFVLQKSYMFCAGANPGRRDGKPATIRLSYGTAVPFRFTGDIKVGKPVYLISFGSTTAGTTSYTRIFISYSVVPVYASKSRNFWDFGLIVRFWQLQKGNRIDGMPLFCFVKINSLY